MKVERMGGMWFGMRTAFASVVSLAFFLGHLYQSCYYN